MARTASTPMIATTIISSISVNPRLAFRIHRLMIASFLSSFTSGFRSQPLVVNGDDVAPRNGADVGGGGRQAVQVALGGDGVPIRRWRRETRQIAIVRDGGPRGRCGACDGRVAEEHRAIDVHRQYLRDVQECVAVGACPAPLR